MIMKSLEVGDREKLKCRPE